MRLCAYQAHTRKVTAHTSYHEQLKIGNMNVDGLSQAFTSIREALNKGRLSEGL